MIWEIERHNWLGLRAWESAMDVPRAMRQLIESDCDEKSRVGFELINNNVVVHGKLYEAAPATAGCLVIALGKCSDIARINILELLNDLCTLNTSDPMGESLYHKCISEVRKGIAIYLQLLQYGTVAEREQCVDLLSECAGSDQTLVEQVLWYFAKVRKLHLAPGLDERIDQALETLRSVLPNV